MFFTRVRIRVGLSQMRRPLPSRLSGPIFPLLDGLDLKLGQLIAAEGAADQERQHDVVALGLSGHTPTRPESAGKEYVIPLSEFSAPKENVAAGGTTECDNPTRILTRGDKRRSIAKSSSRAAFQIAAALLTYEDLLNATDARASLIFSSAPRSSS
jgi:hypothetical protein